MFENIIEQGAVLQLKDDILSRRLAPSMLFYGPSESGKGSTALELARALSCEEEASWKCSCNSCQQHRYLHNNDLLVLGFRPFMAEITACHNVFMNNPLTTSSKMLFLRSIRKLQMRFSPVLMEDDPKLGKVSSVLQSLEEDLNELWSMDMESAEQKHIEKLCASLLKSTNTLVEDGLGNTIPINHIRKASYWCRLAPNGKRKLLLIENAQDMRDEARNSLLKLLEEPPETAVIVLTAQRKEAIMPTILSRLRPYRFLKRSEGGEKEILRRVFHVSDASKVKNISEYLDSFLPANTEKLYPLAAWFLVSLARITAVALKKRGKNLAPFVSALGEHYAPIAESAGLERCTKIEKIVKMLHEKSANFEEDSFSRFLKICLDLFCDAARDAKDPQFIVYGDILKKYISEADTAVNILNQNTTLALEALLYRLKTAMVSPGAANV